MPYFVLSITRHQLKAAHSEKLNLKIKQAGTYKK